MSDADSMIFSYLEESAYGVAPTGEYQTLLITSESLKQNTETVEDDTITSDRRLADIIRSRVDAGGQINFNLRYGGYDGLFRRAIMADSDWSTSEPSGAVTVDVSSSGSTFTRSAGDWTADGYDVGKWVRTSGATLAANNGVFKITALTATVMTVSGGTLADDTSESITFKQSEVIVDGSALASHAFQREFSDLSNEFTLTTGCSISTMSLDAAVGRIITGSFGFVGSTEASATSKTGTGPAAAVTTKPINAIGNVLGFIEAGAVFKITGFTLNMENRLRQRLEIGDIGPTELPGKGRFRCGGTVIAYFKSKAIMDKYRNFTASSLSLVLQDDAGNNLVFELPDVHFTDGQQVAEGIDQDVFARLNWSSKKHSTELIQMRIARIAA